MTIIVKYFGNIAEKTNCHHEAIEMEAEMSIEAFHKGLKKRYPALERSTYRISYNQAMITGSEIVQDGAEIALLPPFAGG